MEKLDFVEKLYTLGNVVYASTIALRKAPKNVIKYAALRVLDMDGDMTELLDGIHSLNQRLPRLLHIYGDSVVIHLQEKVSQAAWRIRCTSGSGAQALSDAYAKRVDADAYKEDEAWVKNNIDCSWDGEADWGL